MNYNRLKEVNTFNTTVFVEFETKEEMEKFLAAKLKFGENEIVAKPRSEKSKNKSNNKKKPDHINLKLVISDKTINKDFKNAVKNNQILRDNVVKYFVERSASERNLCTAVPTKTEEKVATEKVEEQKPVEMVEEKADEKKEEKAEEKTEKVQTTKNAFLALKKNEDLEKVKEALAGLKFHGMGVVVQECTEEDSNKIATFSIPTKSKSRTFKRKPRND
ncbi:hypothetical protein EIN_005670 [Entamoeba invadens IP1]|uniref:Uncharacterized protein n=1 Tax=Entamoeba invadens IP1 TaxID=370355 RepID=A0A0A1UCV3_ENTIV|nr:hypothetical protein EIN_005670 [Entamoeba invadens IP1]ELP93666.1 hypothetical protein EIN_005670 [Entamoeba invadens IP1]|eukprot:XP_004260437.1 hypothetical protein EIN_005670 [Entamoeba invadens IP1]